MIQCIVSQELRLVGREMVEFAKEMPLPAVLPVSSRIKLNLSSGLYVGRVLKVSATEGSELVELELNPVIFQNRNDFERLRSDFADTNCWGISKTWYTV